MLSPDSMEPQARPVSVRSSQELTKPPGIRVPGGGRERIQDMTIQDPYAEPGCFLPLLVTLFRPATVGSGCLDKCGRVCLDCRGIPCRDLCPASGRWWRQGRQGCIPPLPE